MANPSNGQQMDQLIANQKEAKPKEGKDKLGQVDENKTKKGTDIGQILGGITRAGVNTVKGTANVGKALLTPVPYQEKVKQIQDSAIKHN